MDEQTQIKLSKLIAPGKLKYLPTTTSTNNIARQWVQTGAPNFSVVAADKQTAGRGRGQRTWFTPPNAALAFSLILTQNLDQPLPYYTGLGAVSICRALETHLGITPQIKWPNDILINGKKIAGILVESSWLGNAPQAIIIGIGINVTTDSIPDPALLHFPAAAVHSFTPKKIDRFTLLEHILSEIQACLNTSTFSNLIQHWNQRLAYKNSPIILKSPDGKGHKRILLEIDEQGKLMVQHPNGKIEHLTTNEIHLRPDA